MRIEELTLRNFKSFKSAEFCFAQPALIFGSNASGKSNVRDALRFLHGVSRGYSLSEILGGAFKEGAQVWRGIRGGSREFCHFGENRCAFEICAGDLVYSITIEILKKDGVPRVVAESLYSTALMLFDSHKNSKAVKANGKERLHVSLRPEVNGEREYIVDFNSSLPVLPCILDRLNEDARDS